MKRQALQSINVLLTSLGVVRLLLLCVHVQNVYFLLAGWSLFRSDSAKYLGTFVTCLIFCSLWWGSVLCVFYCVKITNYSNRLFMRLKMNINKMVPWLLLITLVISFVSSVPYSWSLVSSNLDNSDTNSTNNGNLPQSVNTVILLIIFFAGSIVPFLICCVAIYLIIVSLLRHTRNMRGRDSGFSDAQRDVHLSVIRSMVSFLVSYTMYNISYILVITHLKTTLSTLIFFAFICAYPSLHSFCFIFSNRELKESFLFLLSIMCLGKLKLLVP
ncbi:hypothetical protein GDO81_020637 [Engystomops pustulosus]|uniref:Taste receptor type 2 n=1 Tax=Engystomops pustulosus TaxID=76066 RepID=A0AAV6YXB0_ENGPU|nr:hypothetical protein GDO81_020637 [Engystomops pustulosus]